MTKESGDTSKKEHKTAKAIWDALKTRHIGEQIVQQARLQTLKSDFEMLHMTKDETIDTFTEKLTTLVNKAASLGHTIEDQTLVCKLLNAVPDRYLQIVASIEQYSDLSEMTMEEVIGRLKTYEERIKYKKVMEDDELQLYDMDNKIFMKVTRQKNRLYKASLRIGTPVCLLANLKDDTWLWHVRLGHLNFELLRSMAQRDLVHGIPAIKHTTQICYVCLIGKHSRASFPKKEKGRSTSPLDFVYGDLCGPITPPTPSRKKYIFLLVDDYSRYMNRSHTNWGDISIKQSAYANKILKEAGTIDCNETLIRIDPRTRLTKNTEGTLVNSTEYRSLIGCLRYLLHTRPDLSYSIGLLSRFIQEPKEQHMKAIKQVLRYVKGTNDYEITYKHNAGNKIQGFSDNSYGVNTQEEKGTTGIIFYYATAAATQALWLKRLLSKLTHSEEEKITIMVDNKSAIALMKNPVFHGRSKHIDTKYHFIRECVEREDIQVEFVSGEYQKAGILTKALLKIKFLTMRQLIGLKDLRQGDCD
nr:ribonuclease H-like domain, reverse transcriptase, RNA-dependent DNA polymerase [Tanacetum cinerariifolium]